MFFVHCVLCSPLATLCGNHLIFNGKGCSQAPFLTCVALWSSIGCVHFFVCSFASRLLVPFSFFSALLTVSSPPLHAQHLSALPLEQHGFFPAHSHRHWFFPDTQCAVLFPHYPHGVQQYPLPSCSHDPCPIPHFLSVTA